MNIKTPDSFGAGGHCNHRNEQHCIRRNKLKRKNYNQPVRK